jgi:hypothetical protein
VGHPVHALGYLKPVTVFECEVNWVNSSLSMMCPHHHRRRPLLPQNGTILPQVRSACPRITYAGATSSRYTTWTTNNKSWTKSCTLRWCSSGPPRWSTPSRPRPPEWSHCPLQTRQRLFPLTLNYKPAWRDFASHELKKNKLPPIHNWAWIKVLNRPRRNGLILVK